MQGRAMRLVGLLLFIAHVRALCPLRGEPPAGHPAVPRQAGHSSESVAMRRSAAPVNWDHIYKDVEALMTDSQKQWPADYGHYGPFFIRLAWHCSGSYRTSDGRGGCDGGRQRFDPERSWEDNTNLDKARALLLPIKEKYGLGLSWGDLFIFAGKVAIESMGGPQIDFCAGRIDDADGSASLQLGPSDLQEELYPCEKNGECKAPLGSTTVGLIYLNPEGPMGRPDPLGSADDIHDTFGRMGMNASETVALIGGGHTFGKTHGACPKGAGEPPNKDPVNPWPGECGTGRGADAYTSGFEGPWTSDPIKWDNEYFKYLFEFKNEWEVHTGPGDHFQWHVPGAKSPKAPSVDGGSTQNIMMLTSDMGVLRDPEFTVVAEQFAKDDNAFRNAFKEAWYKLTSRDMGPNTRCESPAPPAREWQHPVPSPPPPASLPDFSAVRDHLERVIVTPNDALPPDEYDGNPNYGPLFVRLAWQCASTYRSTDYRGGCNGARIRFSPAKDWPINAELDKALQVLLPVKEAYTGLSWADLIAFAGTIALENAIGGSQKLEFCPGRTDIPQNDDGDVDLDPKVTGDFDTRPQVFREWMRLLGLSTREFVALSGGHALGQMHIERTGYVGSWTTTPTKLSNEYFKNILNEQWEEYQHRDGQKQFKAVGKELYALQTDLLLRYDPELASHATDFASDNALFLEDFAAVWTKMMNIDRYDGPTGNLCSKRQSKYNHIAHEQ